MAENSEYSFPFDSEEVNGEPDREYLADDFAEYFRAFISSGTFMKESTNLQVIANGDMTVTLKPGRMIIEGYRYSNGADILIPLSPADGVMNRIDRVSATWSAWDRDIHYTIQKGTPAYRPVPPVPRRNAEYKDYVVADIYVAAGAISIRQEDITDRRLDSDVCGLAIPFYELDTAALYAQLNDFYLEFVDKSNTSYEEFKQMAADAYTEFTDDIMSYISTLKQDSSDVYNELIEQMNEFFENLSTAGQQRYDDFNENISNYIVDLKNKGDTDLAAITQQLLDFRNTNEAEFLAWFERIKGIFGTDPGGNMLNEIEKLSELASDLSDMLYAGAVTARLETEEGDYITDDTGIPILVEWPICRCSG